MSDNEEDKIREQLYNYIENNLELIDKAYDKYLEFSNVLKLENGFVWGRDQLAAAMMMAEERHAHMVEYLEFQLEKNNLDPFSMPKAAGYLLSKNENGSILMTYFREKGHREFIFQIMEPNIIEIMQKKKFL